MHLSQRLLGFIRDRPSLLHALSTLHTSGFRVPETDAVEVSFNARIESELASFGRVLVSQAGFRPASRANFGGTELRPGAGEQGVVWWLGTKGDV